MSTTYLVTLVLIPETFTCTLTLLHSERPNLYGVFAMQSSIVQKKDSPGIPPLKRRNGRGVAESELEQADKFEGQFIVCSTNENT